MDKNSQEGFLKNFSSDFSSGIVVFFVALPLCLGIALASGAPIISGLIAGIIGGIIVGALSGSAVGVSGPAAGLAVIVLGAIHELGSFEAFLAATVLAGFIQVLLGYLRAGIIAYYFPSSVITGMLSGIGILIILKQIPHALGLDRNPEGQLAFAQPDGVNTFSEMTEALNHISFGPFLIALVSLGILLLWDSEFLKRSKLSFVPGAVVAILASALMGLSFESLGFLTLNQSQLVSIPVIDGLSGMTSMLMFPDFSVLTEGVLVYKIALVVAVVASIETLLCVEATDKIDPEKRVTPTNRELKAQGIGNVISGLIGGLPITQVIVRSSANVQAGSKSKISAVFHGFLLILCTLLFAFAINRIPLASLASILFIVGYKLAKPALFKRMWKSGPMQFIPFLVTVVGIVTTDLLTGVAAGLCCGVVSILYENFTLPFAMVEYKKDGVKNIKIALSQQVTFLHKASLLDTLNKMPHDVVVHIDASHSSYIHPDIEEIINDFYDARSAKGEVVCLHILHHKERRFSHIKRLYEAHSQESFEAFKEERIEKLVPEGKGLPQEALN